MLGGQHKGASGHPRGPERPKAGAGTRDDRELPRAAVRFTVALNSP